MTRLKSLGKSSRPLREWQEHVLCSYEHFELWPCNMLHGDKSNRFHINEDAIMSHVRRQVDEGAKPPGPAGGCGRPRALHLSDKVQIALSFPQDSRRFPQVTSFKLKQSPFANNLQGLGDASSSSSSSSSSFSSSLSLVLVYSTIL